MEEREISIIVPSPKRSNDAPSYIKVHDLKSQIDDSETEDVKLLFNIVLSLLSVIFYSSSDNNNCLF